MSPSDVDMRITGPPLVFGSFPACEQAGRVSKHTASRLLATLDAPRIGFTSFAPESFYVSTVSCFNLRCLPKKDPDGGVGRMGAWANGRIGEQGFFAVLEYRALFPVSPVSGEAF